MLLLGCLNGCGYRSPGDVEAAQRELLREIGLPVRSLDGAAPTGTNLDSGQPVDDASSKRSGVPDESLASGTSEDAASAAGDAIGTVGAGTARIEPNMSRIKSDDRTQPWISPTELPRMTWEIQYAGNQPVGYVRRSVEPSKSQGTGALRLEAEARTVLHRNGKTIDQRMQMVSIESENGELMRIEGTIQNGTQRTRFIGVPKAGRLQIEMLSESGKTTQSLPWDASMRGPFAIEQSLIRRPMESKELREVKYFDPFQMVVVNAKLEAMDVLDTTLLDGSSEQLLEIQSTAMVGDTETRALLWIDRKGESRKSYLPGIDVRSFRCDPVTARYVISRSEMEAINIRDVALFGNVGALENAKQVTFRVDLRNADLRLELPSRTDQIARQEKARSWEVTVFDVAAAGTLSDRLESGDAVSEKYLQATPLLNTNHAGLQKFVKQVLAEHQLAEDASAQSRAEALREAISAKWETVAFDKRIRSVAELFRAKQADCVDQAMLLCAALRVSQVPSRVAYGLRYNGSKVRPMMSLHAWTEYHDGTRWLTIDVSRPGGESRLDRVKFSDSPVLSLNGYEPILNIVRMIPELEITVTR